MFRVFVTVFVCILLFVTGQAVDEAVCKAPFQQYRSYSTICYTRLEESICDLIPGSHFEDGNCYIRAENMSNSKDMSSPPASTSSSLATTASPATTVTADPYPQCEDILDNCQEFKDACTPDYQEYMTVQCARTCGYCHYDLHTIKYDVTTTKEPTTTTTPPAQQCEDNAAGCQWQLCHKFNYSAMYKTHCKKTCGYCNNNCRNTRRNCALFARAGHCDVMARKPFMMRHCQEACGWC